MTTTPFHHRLNLVLPIHFAESGDFPPGLFVSSLITIIVGERLVTGSGDSLYMMAPVSLLGLR
jgi:hypothetical protein